MAIENDNPEVILENENDVNELIDQVVPDVEDSQEQEPQEDEKPAPK